MVNKQLREERHHGDISLPVSGYRVQPPYSAHLGELECHWHSEMELFQVERGTMQVQCGSEYFEAKAGDLVFFNSGNSSKRATHVGIYTGNGKFVHASTSTTGVIISDLNSSYYTNTYVGARRL